MKPVRPFAPALLLLCAASALVSIVPALSAPPPGDAAADIKSEEGLRKALDALEIPYEAACRKMAQAAWSAAMGETSAGSGASRAGALRDFTAIYADPKLDEVLAYWTRRTTVTSDPTLSRRVQLWNQTREVAAVVLDPAISALESDLAARIEGHRFTLDGKAVTRAELARILATDPDPAARRKAWAALASVVSEVKVDVKRLVRMRADKSQPRRNRYFHDLIYRAQDLDPYWVYHVMGLFTTRTNGAWANLLDSLRAAAGLKEIQPWDLDFAMTQRAKQKGLPRIVEAVFRPEGAIPATRKLMESLGFDPSRAPLRIEVHPLAAASLWIPVLIPTDLRAVVSPAPGPFGAIAFYETVLREQGRALQAAFNPQGAPMLKGYPWIPGAVSEVYAEGMAGALGDFLRDPLFASKVLGLSAGDARTFLEMEKERRLLQLRRLLLGMGIEFTIYANPDADLDGRYGELAAKALGVKLSGPDAALWTADPMMISQPVHYQDLVLAGSVTADLHEKLREIFGDKRLGSGKVAPWLIERCYAPGEMGTMQARLAASIEGGFGFDALLLSVGGDPVKGK